MANILLVPFGSHGDVHPYIPVGKALRDRGHRVTMITAAPFEELARKAGFEFVPVGTEEEFNALLTHPDAWHPTKSMKILFGSETFNRGVREAYDKIVAKIEPKQTVIVGGSLAFAARIVHEKHGTPLATVHLQSVSYPSVTDPPTMSTWAVRPNRPHWWMRMLYWVGERYILDPLVMNTVNGLRRDLGLKPIRRIWGAWRHSPQCILGFFPKWFGFARDWPAHFQLFNFVLFDDAHGRPVPDAVQHFLNAGPPPVVFSFGSAMRIARPYLQAAAEACEDLGVRGILLAKDGPQVPPNLPKNVLQADYAPFSKVFPRAACVVHHGGIGTTAQALRAGVRQVIMPLAFDQHDNAARIQALGAGKTLLPKRFTRQNVAKLLSAWLADPAPVKPCRELAAKVTAEDPLPGICREIEALIGRDVPPEKRS